MSPILNTLASGHVCGTEKLSPKKARCGWGKLVEFRNWPLGRTRPAALSATGDAGMTPPFAPMAARLDRPPRPTSHSHGMCRFWTRK
jgi:hypothetical protein